jgi:vitamin B12 transporter
MSTWLRGFVVVLCLLLPDGLEAQTPPELVGRVRERGGGPLDAVAVELRETGTTTWSDPAGNFRLRASAAGEYTVRFSRMGWATVTRRVRLAAGMTVNVDVELTPTPVQLDSVIVASQRATLRLDRAELTRPGITTVGDAVARLPGVVVSTAVPGGPQLVSVRGSSHDQVLVLVDGIAINDPITGTADLSRLTAANLESITLVPGALGAEHGARALAGVILVETRRAGAAPGFMAGIGSLGSRRLDATAGGQNGIAWSTGAAVRSSTGSFEYALPLALSDTTLRRTNADQRAADVFLSVAHALRGGRLQARVGAQAEERGLPGRGYAPSPTARQELRALRASAAWQQAPARSSLRIQGSATTQRSVYRDASPPFGLAYDDSVFAHALDVRLEYGLDWSAVSAGAGVEAQLQQINTRLLEPGVRQPRQVAGFVRADAHRLLHLPNLTGSAQLRLDRDEGGQETFANYATSISYAPSSLAFTLAYRTGFNPPSLGDQFFRESFGVQPNPALRAERVRELDLNANWSRQIKHATLSVNGSAYVADIRGMIVWAPDYRFIWSPANEDVNRTGFELNGEARLASEWYARAQLAHTRITYDRTDDPGIQVLYRPRNTAGFTLERQTRSYSARVEADYTGARNTVPSALNPLRGFWSTAAALRVHTRLLGWESSAGLRINRLLDETDTLIFGYPDPGRVVHFELRIGANESDPHRQERIR